jgi:poly-beta-1,6-N-acetyl-D-glucosamine synthase
MIVLFILSIGLAGWAFIGYPLLAIALASRRQPLAWPGYQAAVTVVIAARNEAHRIQARIANLLGSDFPPAELMILIVDDGSSDATTQRALAIDDPRISVIRLDQPLGKAEALNAAMRQVRTPLTVFADARQAFSSQALANLVAAFGDPGVGVASGRLVLHEAEAGGLYWRIESALRQAESRLGWAHAASGAIYAIRSDLFEALPAGLLLDDVYTPVQIAQRGLRVAYVAEALAFEPSPSSARQEFSRKIRTLSGNWQLIALAPWLLLPWRNRLFFAWVSHKFSRLLAPWALLLALLVSMLGEGSLLAWAFWLQLLAYVIAVLALLLPRLACKVPLAPAAASFLLLNVAALLALPAYLAWRDAARLWRR